MHAMARPAVLLAATLLLAGAAGACTRAPERVADCVAPADEATLLAEYEGDPALAAAPAGAIRRDEPIRTAACYRVGSPGREEITRTTVSVQYDLASDLGPDDFEAFVEPLASRDGWQPLESRVSLSDGLLAYCRVVRGTPTVLWVSWQNSIRPDGEAGPTVPGTLTTMVYALAEGDPQRDDSACAR